VSHQTITTPAQLAEFCRQLSKAELIGIDTEFVSEDTYRPELCLVQVATHDELAVIDPYRAGDLKGFWQTLATGRHTTSQSSLHLLGKSSDDGWIVDSPGLKVFGLAHIPPDALAEAFVELRPLLGHCRFRDCRHDREPGCAVQQAVMAGRVAPFRVALLHRLVEESRAARDPVRRG